MAIEIEISLSGKELHLKLVPCNKTLEACNKKTMNEEELDLKLVPCNKKKDAECEKKRMKEAKTNHWMYAVLGIAPLSIIIILSLISVLVYWKNKAWKENQENESKNTLYGTEYYDGSEITWSNPNYISFKK